MAGGTLQRARFMAGLLFTVAKRALPQWPARTTDAGLEDPEPLIEALQTGDIVALNAYGRRVAMGHDSLGTPWFFIALETGSLSAVEWFLTQGANPSAADRAGRLPLEAVIQRVSLADEFDDHAADGPAMLTALVTAGADPMARSLQGMALSDLARAAGLTLPQ
jgi:hypothetical protein